MSDRDHLQLAEVLDYLKAKQDCAIIHPEMEQGVSIEFDREKTWSVRTTLKESPAAKVIKQLKSVGIETESGEMRMYFGPHAGKTIQFFTVGGDFKNAAAAARAALLVLEILWRVPATDWLWVTAMQHDDRGEPNRPSVWPPAAR